MSRPGEAGPPARADLGQRYIELLKKSLLNELYVDQEVRLYHLVRSVFGPAAIDPARLFAELVRPETIPDDLVGQVLKAKAGGQPLVFTVETPQGRRKALNRYRAVTDFPLTMIGRRRLDNLQFCVEKALEDGVPGDLIETGVWRGGASIFMRGLLAAHGVSDRLVFAADSFMGLPKPSRPEDQAHDLSREKLPFLAVSLAEVKANFARFGLLDDRVRFLEGWFKDTLPAAPIDRLAVLRLDGDLYESTLDALTALYDKVSPGGFIIVDDYFAMEPCQQAVTDFRKSRGLTEEIVDIDHLGAFWRKRA